MLAPLALIGLLAAGPRPVLLAVIDDAFEAKSPASKDFWIDTAQARTGANPALSSWDVADDDADVSPPGDRKSDFWHGTTAANLVAERLRQFLGKDVSRKVEFLALKALSDGMAKPDMSKGYLALERAKAARADVILCEWAGGTVSDGQRALVRSAVESGALVIAPAGNEGTRNPMFPASLPGVLAVAAVAGDGRKMPLSGFGDWVSLSARGDTIQVSIEPVRPDPIRFSQTSRAAAEAAALAVALKVRNPSWSSDKIRQVMMSSARAREPIEPRVSGTLGAGVVDPVHAFLGSWAKLEPPERLEHSAGMIDLSRKPWKTRIEGPGSFRGIRIELVGTMESRSRVTAVGSDGHRYAWTAWDLSRGVEVPYQNLSLEWRGSKKATGYLAFRKLELDSSRLFCRDTRELSGESGVIDDGSGPHEYAHGSDCRWHIRVAEGRRIRLEFTEFHTAKNLDHLHVFHGESARQSDLIAMLSGVRSPPSMVSPSNQVMLWF
ncbi:MAG: S8 family serine peptidase, partial [Fibrobacterota bacterium]